MAECFLFGHSKVVTVAGLGGTCYTLSATRPGAQEEVEEEEDREVGDRSSCSSN